MSTRTVRPVLAAAFAAAMVSSAAFAAPVVLDGNFVRAGVGDRGTLGSGGATAPGIQYDKTGTQNFGVNDYLTPGTPWEAFGVKVNGTLYFNSNNGTANFGSASPVLGGIVGWDNAATWKGGNSLLSIVNEYFFNDNDQRINIRTTITALDNLVNVKFGRALDPDPDVNTFGSFNTQNQRGLGSIPASDIAFAVGTQSGLPIGIFTNSSIKHNSGVVSDCCSTIDPDTYLAGPFAGANGDFGIGLGFELGNIARGSSVVIEYAYVMAQSVGGLPGGGGGSVPEPGTILLGALAALAAFGRRKRR